ncbi:MAG: anthranilate phosphoribosyltransferase, partial [Rhodothermales bacterium]|nr:anthranilate phosphoribosyltransferase [Rhodothermales bacterium]
SGTFNISTAAAFVCAGAGVTVAKHGNRSVSSRCGSADVLEALGVHIELRAPGVEACLREAGIAFLFAPFFHPAMRFVMPVRRSLGVRTFFNILGPLCNPAGVRRQLVGAFSVDVAQRMAAILARLDAEAVIALHAEDGLDEVSLSAETAAFLYDAGRPDRAEGPLGFRIRPEDHGIGRAPLAALQGGSAEDNAAILHAIFSGERGPRRDVTVLNAAYALRTSGRFGDDPAACFEAAEASIDSGAARDRLQRLVDVSQRVAEEAPA